MAITVLGSQIRRVSRNEKTGGGRPLAVSSTVTVPVESRHLSEEGTPCARRR